METKKLFLSTLAFLLVIPMLSACGGGTPNQESKRVLRIGVMSGGGNEQNIRQQYTDIYEYMNPNMTIEIIPAVDYSKYNYMIEEDEKERPDAVEEMKKLMTGSNPVDIVLMDKDAFQVYTEEGQLKLLDSFMKKDSLDTSDFVPSIMEHLKAMGNGNLYGLAPTFYTSAIFYNKTLFKEAGVELPKDNMTWDEAFDLARRVTKGEGADRKFGFNFSNYWSDNYYHIFNYAKPLQLRLYDDKAEKMMVNSPQWEKVFDSFLKLEKEHIFPVQTDRGEADRPYNPIDRDPFLSGKVAMIVNYYDYTAELLEVSKYAGNLKNFKMPDWDVVTIPHHVEAPEVNSWMEVNTILGINNQAQNPDDAWNFIRFIHSEDWAKLKSRSSRQLVTRQTYIKPQDGMNYNIQAFYAMKPDNSKEPKITRQKRNLWVINDAGSSLYEKAKDGKLSTADMLKKWEAVGSTLLQAIKNNPNGNINEDETIRKAIYGE
ncbi:extracellular solute-binding protein [Paenibacillus sp. ACRRX]|uniref:ABC transporter substrate-binding protein n=1 Tax=unclassified Paenibacillus TaxID=185978 RepID=UPI001EF4B028|nr:MULTISPECIES: extracellular solute-binding protein [unclassified Paenibacillus]MCG7406857.1 extracellular solute-binding protein [Paenibacillus sp. ACRRX]MDK8179790.1 extracellular solute-binding protein [Paenibacillus sp. UMB4589-SE434]